MSTLSPKKKRLSSKNFLKVGIDEAGRGPLAGPVVVGVVVFLKPVSGKFRGAKDSKKISEKKRETWFEVLKKEKSLGNLDFSVGFSNNQEIDRYGISKSIKLAMGRALNKLNLNPKKSKVFLDGLLKAPSEFSFQKTIIKGDEKIKIISLASIVAKVSRDRKMRQISMKYKNYGFENHKGYGTSEHLQAIKKYKVSPIHRKTFLNNFLTGIGDK